MNQPEEFLRACIHDILPISSSANAAIRQITDYVQLAKNEVFISSERANAYEYFLLQGICRSYLIDPVGDDITISFFQGPSVLSPHSIRTANRLSLYNFQACTDILLGRIDAEAFMHLMITNPEIREFGNTVMRLELQNKVAKEIGLASLTARERLLRLRTQYNMLENLVPHTQIASYLGISAISLSRLRSDIAKE